MRNGYKLIYPIVTDALVVLTIPVAVVGILDKSYISGMVLEPLNDTRTALTLFMAYYFPCFCINIFILYKSRNRYHYFLIFSLILGWLVYLRCIFWIFFYAFWRDLQSPYTDYSIFMNEI